MSEIKLKPCPFCGGEVEIEARIDVIGYKKCGMPIEKSGFAVECTNDR